MLGLRAGLDCYPFLIDPEAFLRERGLPQNLEDLAGSRFFELGFERVLKDLGDSAGDLEGLAYDERILSFHVAVALASMAGRRVFRRVVEAEARRAGRCLEHSGPEEALDLLRTLGYSFEKAGERELCSPAGFDRRSGEVKVKCYSYKIRFTRYLRLLREAREKDPKLALVHRPVRYGHVYVEGRALLELAKELVRARIEALAKPYSPPEPLKPYIAKILELARSMGIEAPSEEDQRAGASIRIKWIEDVVEKGLPDGRKRFILYALTPYLATTLEVEEEEALEIVRRFLENSCRNWGACSRIYEAWIRSSFRGAKRKKIKPTRLESLDEELRKNVESIVGRG